MKTIQGEYKTDISRLEVRAAECKTCLTLDAGRREVRPAYYIQINS